MKLSNKCLTIESRAMSHSRLKGGSKYSKSIKSFTTSNKKKDFEISHMSNVSFGSNDDLKHIDIRYDNLKKRDGVTHQAAKMNPFQAQFKKNDASRSLGVSMAKLNEVSIFS
jgi:hypothetical protein